MPVLCVVLATGADGQEIEEVVREAASASPRRRKVVSIGEPDCPPDDRLREWCGDNAAPGALFLRRDGTLSAVLSVDEAKSFPAVQAAFAEAAQ